MDRIISFIVAVGTVVCLLQTCDNSAHAQAPDIYTPGVYADPTYCFVGSPYAGWETQPGRYSIRNASHSRRSDGTWTTPYLLEPQLEGGQRIVVLDRSYAGWPRMRLEALDETSTSVVTVLRPGATCYGAGITAFPVTFSAKRYATPMNPSGVGMGVGHYYLRTSLRYAGGTIEKRLGPRASLGEVQPIVFRPEDML